MLKYLPSLTKLDNDIVSPEERETAKLISFDIGDEQREKKSAKEIKREPEHKNSHKLEPSAKLSQPIPQENEKISK